MAGISDLVRVVVCDAGPPIHLDELGALDLLHDFPSVLVPDAVSSEVKRQAALPRSVRQPRRVVRQEHPLHPLGPALIAFSRLSPLHAGETQALAVASEQGADLVLTANTAAMLAAPQLGHRVHGTLGILVRAARPRNASPEFKGQIRLLPPACALQP